MKAQKFLLGIALLTSMLACEDPTDPETKAERLAGRWMVEEEDHLKSVNDSYHVEIEIHPIYEDRILIDNFYALSSDNSIYADINNMTLEVPEQEIDGFSIHGSATIASDYKHLTWVYFVDDGSGTELEVHAEFTKIE